MEHLTLSDAPPPQMPGGMPGLGRGGPQAPPPTPQLPPQMFTTAAQLLDLTDKKLLVSLRDGRRFIGVLRSWDQFANLVLQSTIERITVPHPKPSPKSAVVAAAAAGSPSTPDGGLYADVPRGLFLVRGENVLLLGEIDLDRDDEAPPGYEKADADLVAKLAKEKRQAEKAREKTRLKKLASLGFEGESMGEILL